MTAAVWVTQKVPWTTLVLQQSHSNYKPENASDHHCHAWAQHLDLIGCPMDSENGFFHLLIFVFLLLSEIFSLSKCLTVSTIQQISSTKWEMDLHCSMERIDLLFFNERNNKGFLLWPNWISFLWILLLTRTWSWALSLVSLMHF